MDMDVRTALIAGTAFAGVLIAGAVAAPRGGGGGSADGSAGASQSLTASTGQAPGDSLVNLVSSSARGEHERDHDDDDDDHDDDDHHEEDDD